MSYEIMFWIATALILIITALIYIADYSRNKKLRSLSESIRAHQKECDALIAQANKKIAENERIKTNVFEARRKGDI
tara:strand:+ start:16 stop:246 length:231 start_codon:yes stop_codon:yes gene_type:complete